MIDYSTEALRWTIVCWSSRTQSLLITEGPSKGFCFWWTIPAFGIVDVLGVGEQGATR